MRLERASYKAIQHACMNFHYAKRLPANPMIGYSVFNDTNEWCGVIIFNNGSLSIEKPYKLSKGNVCELVRVALNGKQETTSKAVSIAIKLFSKSNPLVKLLVSYADTDQNHNGTLYQATNWYLTDSKVTGDEYINPYTNKPIHSRSHSESGYKNMFGVKKQVFKTSQLTRVKKGIKHKYIYPLDKTLVPLCKSLAKPYPKSNAAIVQGSISGFQSEDGSRTDLAAQTGNNGIQH
jgi:hypothetical protein